MYKCGRELVTYIVSFTCLSGTQDDKFQQLNTLINIGNSREQHEFYLKPLNMFIGMRVLTYVNNRKAGNMI